MRIFRMFLLHFQNVFEYRARSFVWFVISLITPLTMILFWNGASQNQSQFSFSSIASYYFMLARFFWLYALRFYTSASS